MAASIWPSDIALSAVEAVEPVDLGRVNGKNSPHIVRGGVYQLPLVDVGVCGLHWVTRSMSSPLGVACATSKSVVWSLEVGGWKQAFRCLGFWIQILGVETLVLILALHLGSIESTEQAAIW